MGSTEARQLSGHLPRLVAVGAQVLRRVGWGGGGADDDLRGRRGEPAIRREGAHPVEARLAVSEGRIVTAVVHVGDRAAPPDLGDAREGAVALRSALEQVAAGVAVQHGVPLERNHAVLAAGGPQPIGRGQRRGGDLHQGRRASAQLRPVAPGLHTGRHQEQESESGRVRRASHVPYRSRSASGSARSRSRFSSCRSARAM